MGHLTVLFAALALVTAGCGAASPPTPTIAPATPTPAATTPAPATPAPSSEARLINATVTFDGKTCKYDGPAVVPTGSAIEWTFTTTPAATEDPSGETILVVMATRYGTTWDDVLESVTGHNWTEATPPYYQPGPIMGYYGPDDAAIGTPFRTLMTPYPYLVACYEEAAGRLYPAILLQVIKG